MNPRLHPCQKLEVREPPDRFVVLIRNRTGPSLLWRIGDGAPKQSALVVGTLQYGACGVNVELEVFTGGRLTRARFTPETLLVIRQAMAMPWLEVDDIVQTPVGGIQFTYEMVDEVEVDTDHPAWIAVTYSNDFDCYSAAGVVCNSKEDVIESARSRMHDDEVVIGVIRVFLGDVERVFDDGGP